MLKRTLIHSKTSWRGVLVYTLSLCFLGLSFSTPTEAATKENGRPSDKSRRLTQFEWDPIPKAKAYEIEIRPVSATGEKKDPFRFNVTDTSWNGELKPGQYTMRLRSLDRRGVPGEWSRPESFYVKLYAPTPISPANDQVINSNEEDSAEVKLSWVLQSEASLYKLHIEDESRTVVQDHEVKENQITLTLPVARRYQWSLIGYDKQSKEGEPFGPPISFTLMGKMLETPQIQIPDSPFVRSLSWDPVPKSENYSYQLFVRGPNRKWNSFAKEDNFRKTNLPFPADWKGGEYKFSVTANANLRVSSKTHTIIFEVAKGDRSPEAEQIARLRESIERTSEWYGIASYLITQIEYSATNYDKGSAPTFKAVGGTGRLGGGYLDPKTPFGFLGIADFSGFTIGQKNYTYASLEAHGILRQTISDIGELRSSVGPYYKELPEILGSADSGEFQLSQLSALGLHAGGELWYSLNRKLGAQVNARIYYPVFGKTPFGQPIVATPSFQIGFLGSLRLNKKATGLMGYAYRKDLLEYKTQNSRAINAGYSKNQSAVVGHYLNFFLEWDF